LVREELAVVCGESRAPCDIVRRLSLAKFRLGIVLPPTKLPPCTKIITALRLSPVCGFVQILRVRQSSLTGISGSMMVFRIARPTSVMPYFSARPDAS
jgi:hypothetical protein